MTNKSRTAKLWIQLLYHMSVIKEFIFAERSDNWHGHLNACAKLLNVFAATGHIHYAKSCRLYLQQMRDLVITHPWLYQKYSEEGKHAIHRTDHPLWSDLVIEQVEMASLKSRGGLSHGRGMTESVRTQWIHTMHHSVAIHDAMCSH